MSGSTSAEEDQKSSWISKWALIIHVTLLQKGLGTNLANTQASAVILCLVLTTSLFKKKKEGAEEITESNHRSKSHEDRCNG